MPVTEIVSDADSLTLTVVAEFDAPVERVWRAYSDPRQVERFWGPPGWPATFTVFDQRVGGVAQYLMTGPRGETSAGRWEFLHIDEPRRFDVVDSFVDDSGEPLADFPSMRLTFEFTPDAERTRMVNVISFESAEALEQVLQMGVVEGTRLAMGQIDTALRDLKDWGGGTQQELLDDTHVRITRVVAAPRDTVWRAHNDPELMRQWMLGPEGWEMTECVPPRAVGDAYRTSWAPVGDTEGEPFGFEGEALLVDAPRRAVISERMIGTDGPTTINDLNLYEQDGVTLVTSLIEYPDKETRDMILATGMVDGMEDSYARLERIIRHN